jgi:hypothetical protein
MKKDDSQVSVEPVAEDIGIYLNRSFQLLSVYASTWQAGKV